VLDGVSLTIRSGERVGVVGINGSGKSTLARILAGIEAPDGGTVARRRGTEIAYLTQEPKFDGAKLARQVVLEGLTQWSDAKDRHERATTDLDWHVLSGADLENLLEAQTRAAGDVERLGGWDRMHQVDAMLGHLGIRDSEAPIGTLSGGEQRRVALARILIARPHLALLDEPTNHLDVETIEWLENYLKSEHEGALLLITHDRYLLDRVAERTLELERGKLHSYDGGYELYLEAKAERLAHEARTESNRQNFLRRELEWLSRQPRARRTKQRARIQRIEGVRAAPSPKGARAIVLDMADTRTGKAILEMSDVTLELGGRRLVERFSWVLTKGERVGVVGRNGTGKTTLIRAILGAVPVLGGRIAVGQNTRIAYFDQTRETLDDDQSIFDNVVGDHPSIEVGGQPEPADLPRTISVRSDEAAHRWARCRRRRARVVLAKLLAEPANLVILDEPTNDLDVATLGALRQMLLDFGGTSIVVTHDRWFLDRIATSILAFEGNGRVVRYAGNYDTYRRLREEFARAGSSSKERPKDATSPLNASAPNTARKPRVLTQAEKKELETIVDRIDQAERVVADLERGLEDPDLYARGGDEVRSFMDRIADARAEAQRLTARWEELERVRAGRLLTTRFPRAGKVLGVALRPARRAPRARFERRTRCSHRRTCGRPPAAS
jgi:ATP-binding cassette subfamily F protein uup